MLESVNLHQTMMKEEYKPEIRILKNQMKVLQQKVKEAGLPVIILGEGWSARGKGKAIGRLFEMLDPRKFKVYSTVTPTIEEERKPFLWRHWSRIPVHGQMAIFDRSWYQDIIVGVTEELSAQEIYEMGRKVEPFLIAKDTRIGHIHLSVKDSQLASSFYQEVLELADKFTIPSASWIASGDYHHHLAVNEWGGKDLAKREENMPGLAYYVVEVEVKEDLIAIAERANNRGAEVKWLSSNALTFEDNDGILTRVRKKYQ